MHPVIKEKEERFGFFAGAFANKVDCEYKPLVFASPVSFRDPSVEKTWHYFFIGLPWSIKLLELVMKIVIALFVGIVKFITFQTPEFKTCFNDSADMLFVTTNQITSINTGGVLKTSYFNFNEDAKSDWLVLNYGSKSEKFSFERFYISRIKIIKINAMLLKKSFRTLVECWKIQNDKLTQLETFLLFVAWLLRLDWMIAYALGLKFKELVKKNNYKLVYSPHEMLSYSRALWFWAKQLKLKSATLQHAVIHRNKLSFFPTQFERSGGFKTPDIFFVLSDKYSSLLKPHMPNTEFILGASPRFNHMLNSSQSESCNNKNKDLLIVTSMCWYDIKLMLSLANKLSRIVDNMKIRIRLHPFKNCNIDDFIRIYFLKFNKRVILSNQSLREDLNNASIVLGCGSTVMFEAMLRNKVTAFVLNDKFTNFSGEIILAKYPAILNFDQINKTCLENLLLNSELKEAQMLARDLLGLDHKEIDSFEVRQLFNERAMVLQ